MKTTSNTVEVQQPPFFRRILNFLYAVCNAYIYKPYLTLKSYYFYFKHINSPLLVPIEQIYLDTQKFNEDEFRENSFYF